MEDINVPLDQEEGSLLPNNLRLSPEQKAAYLSGRDYELSGSPTGGKASANTYLGDTNVRGKVAKEAGIRSIGLGASKNIGGVNVSADALHKGLQKEFTLKADMPIGAGMGYLNASRANDANTVRAGLNGPIMGGRFSAEAGSSPEGRDIGASYENGNLKFSGSRTMPTEGRPDNRFNIQYGRSFAQGGLASLHRTANSLAAQGRHGDDTLIHVSRKELAGLASLNGGKLSTNPQTGLPEAFSLGSLLPTIAAIGLTSMGVPAWGVGLGAGATAMLQGKSLTQGLVTGLLAGATAGVGDSLAQAGKGAAEQTAGTALTNASQEVGNAALQTGAKEAIVNQAAQGGFGGLTEHGTSLLDYQQMVNQGANPLTSGFNPQLNAAAEAAKVNAIGQMPGGELGAITKAAQNKAVGPDFLPEAARQKLGNISAGLAQPDALKNALMSKSGAALLMGGVGSLMPDPNKPVVPPSTFSGSSYRPMGAYNRNYTPAPVGYDPNQGEYNYFPGDRYYRAAAGGSMQDILAQPVMPPNQMMGGSTPYANQFYPGANIAQGGASQAPSATDVVGGYDQSINQYTGEPVRMAFGGVATLDTKSEMSTIRALRRAYPHRADAERDAMVKGSPAQQMGVTSADSPILTYAFGPKQELSGRGDGMSDDIPAMIGGQKQARLSDGEFVIPADVVAGLGNGSTKAGSGHLYEMLDRVREARTGTKKQGKQIKAGEFMPA